MLLIYWLARFRTEDEALKRIVSRYGVLYYVADVGLCNRQEIKEDGCDAMEN